MKKTLTLGAFSGLCAAILTGAAEGLLGNGAGAPAAALLGALLLIPCGVLLGTTLSLVPLLWPPGRRPMDRLRTLGSPDAPQESAALLVFGLLLLPVAAGLFHGIYFFATRFHHMGLAALSLTFIIPLAGAATTTLASAAIRLLGTRLGRPNPGPVRRALRRPAVSAVSVLVIWAIVVLPPVIKGPDATGLFGFLGLLVKDGLKAGPLLSLLALTILSAGFQALLGRRPYGRAERVLYPAATALVAAVALFAAHLTADTLPAAADRLDSAEGAAGLTARMLRRLGDRDKDGYARWMGGRDCNDDNPNIYPRAADIPGNGIDEDCSGEDLNLDALRAQAALPDAVPAKALKRPTLPEDVSLLLISVDTLRWNAPGFMGYERNITPNLDKVALQGTIYDRAYALGSYTGQAIPPMMTGKYASELHRNDRHETRISTDETFAAELICKSGVQCAAVLPHFLFKPRAGWHQGFQEWTVVDASPPGPGHIDTKYNSDRVAEATLAWLDKPENTAGRFFLWAHFLDPHKEYIEHKGFEKFGDDRRAMYDHEVLFTDHHVGRILDKFRTLEAAKRTVIIITADHGEAFNEHGRWCHGKELWEEIIRVPMSVTGPGIAKKRIARPTSQIDLFPTLLDLFGAPIPEGIHGRSLLPDWSDGPLQDARPIVADQPENGMYEPRRIFIYDGWKLHDLPAANSYRLYRLTGDIEEGDSLTESEPDAFKRIKAAYDLFLAESLKPIRAVPYDTGPLRDMPLPKR